ncbi:MAG: DUF6883 domain-containing protein [Chloroherpetonaceae bacterium]
MCSPFGLARAKARGLNFNFTASTSFFSVAVRLPNGEKAVIPPSKVEGYALNFQHETGKHKAIRFKSVLGIELHNSDILYEALRDAARSGNAELLLTSNYGDIFRIDFVLTTSHGNAIVRSGWLVDKETSLPKLTTVFVKEPIV